MEVVKIAYDVGVKVPAGWRSVRIVAAAGKTSEKMATVISVLTVDGESPHYGQSRTGARRQEFNGHYVSSSEVGKKKRLSSCQILE